MKPRVFLVVSFAILSLAASSAITAQETPSQRRMIYVTGTAEINVAPDEVVLDLRIESHDKELSSSKSQNDARARKVISVAMSAGVLPKDTQTSAVRMGPDYSEEKVPRLIGYEVSQSITITLRDLSKYESLMTKLLEAGINRVDNVSFDISEPRKFADEARAKAILAAKEKAIAMAATLGETVGRPWEIVEEEPGSSSVNLTQNSLTSYSRSRNSEESSVAPGQVTIRVSIRVSFLLQ